MIDLNAIDTDNGMTSALVLKRTHKAKVKIVWFVSTASKV